MQKLPEMLEVRMRSEDLVAVLCERSDYREWATNLEFGQPLGTAMLCKILGIEIPALRHAIYRELVTMPVHDATA
jgi:hypothetical protein